MAAFLSEIAIFAALVFFTRFATRWAIPFCSVVLAAIAAYTVYSGQSADLEALAERVDLLLIWILNLLVLMGTIAVSLALLLRRQWSRRGVYMLAVMSIVYWFTVAIFSLADTDRFDKWLEEGTLSVIISLLPGVFWIGIWIILCIVVRKHFARWVARA